MELINHLVYIHINDATQQGKLLKYFSHKHIVSEGSQKQRICTYKSSYVSSKKAKLTFNVKVRLRLLCGKKGVVPETFGVFACLVI